MTEAEIRDTLEEFASEKNITPLLARDFGSRATGLADETSDHDILFIFTQPAERYLLFDEKTESICTERNGYDFQAWSLRKFTEAILDDDPMAIEFLMSDLEYYSLSDGTKQAFESLQEHATENFNRMSLYYHYQSLAKKNYNKYIKSGNDPTLKRMLNIYRGMCYAKYIHSTQEMPPLKLDQFMELAESELGESTLETLSSLAERKRNKTQDTIDIKPDNYADEITEFLEFNPDPDNMTTPSADSEPLNTFTRAILEQTS